MSTVSQRRAVAGGAASPLPVGDTIDRGFALIGRRRRALLLPPLVLNLIPLAVGLVLGVIGAWALGPVATTAKTVRESTFFGDSTLNVRDVADYTSGQTALLVGLGVVAGLVYVWCLIAAAVAVMRAVADARAGRAPTPLRAAVRRALRGTPRVFGLTVAFALLALVALAAAGALAVLAAQVSADLTLAVVALAALALAWAGVRLALWPVVAVADGAGLAAFAGAWRRSRGRFWALTGVLLLVALVVAVAFAVLGVALDLAYGALVDRDAIVGVVALLPSLLLAVLFAVVLTALAVAPLAVAHQTLAVAASSAAGR